MDEGELEALARSIDHTLLRADATDTDIRQLCSEAAGFRFAAVCVNPTWVGLASDTLKDTGVAVCSVVGFPLGATPSEVKCHEARGAMLNGAREIDMVLNIGRLKSEQDSIALDDIRRVVETVHEESGLLKVILETALLNREEKMRACGLSRRAGADFVKTSTGFNGGATTEDIVLMRQAVGKEMGVKASGGIRDVQTARRLMKAGATRIGSSSSVQIMRDASAGSQRLSRD